MVYATMIKFNFLAQLYITQICYLSWFSTTVLLPLLTSSQQTIVNIKETVLQASIFNKYCVYIRIPHYNCFIIEVLIVCDHCLSQHSSVLAWAFD